MKREDPTHQAVLDRPATTVVEEPTQAPMGAVGGPPTPISYVPTPTREYRETRKAMQATLASALPRLPIPVSIPRPIPWGARVLLWKHDPSLGEIGVRKAFLPNLVLEGPRDARVATRGLPEVGPNAMGDLVQTPGTPAFDAVHTYAVVRQTLTMYQRALERTPHAPVPWQWNDPQDTEPLQVYPHAANMMNAFYSRTQRALKFGYFTKPGSPPGIPPVFTCRSLDIVAHATGHAILDALKPQWLAWDNPLQTGGVHESFADLTAIFLAFSQLDQLEAMIAQTKANLHDKTYLEDLAEELGLALGKPNGLRNADNEFRLGQVGNDVHAISQIFTGAIYDILADIFAFERMRARKRDCVILLYELGQYLNGLVVRAIVEVPDTRATYVDVVNQMLRISQQDGKPPQYRNFIRNRFAIREVVAADLVAWDEEKEGVLQLQPKVQDAAGVFQDRSRCCGTMQLYEYNGVEEEMQAELKELQESVTAGAKAKGGR
ncbi:MAG: hypothetical protein ACE5G2_03595 [Candidatus Krumholzibacteriia bacterium]